MKKRNKINKKCALAITATAATSAAIGFVVGKVTTSNDEIFESGFAAGFDEGISFAELARHVDEMTEEKKETTEKKPAKKENKKTKKSSKESK